MGLRIVKSIVWIWFQNPIEIINTFRFHPLAGQQGIFCTDYLAGLANSMNFLKISDRDLFGFIYECLPDAL
jgi:hypothetical protein